MYDYVIKLTHQPKKQVLTDVMLETLAIIAYKQPVTKLEIEKIRGVKCDHAINKLIEYNLIQEVGRLDAPGRPILFGTTEEFLRSFGVHGIEEMPGVSCSHAINKLLEYGLITEAGRLNAPGRPILLATTEEFLRTFGVQSVENLPSISPEELDTLKTEAEEEVQMTLDV